MSKQTTELKLVGSHPEDLADGRILEVGGTVRLDRDQVEHPHNKRLIADGKLIDAAVQTKERD